MPSHTEYSEGNRFFSEPMPLGEPSRPSQRRNRAWRRVATIPSVFVLTAACGSDAALRPSSDVITDPGKAVFVTTDIERFWAAYDAGGANGTASAFQVGYLDRGSSGLRDFIRLRNLTAANLVNMVRTYPRYFADIRASTLRLATDASVQNRIRDNYRKIADMYAASVFPPVTFLIGRFSTGGTTSENGML